MKLKAVGVVFGGFCCCCLLGFFCFVFLENHKIDKPLVGLMTKKREKIQITNIRNGSYDIIVDSTDVKNKIREYYENPEAHILNKLDKMDKFLERHYPCSLRSKEIT